MVAGLVVLVWLLDAHELLVNSVAVLTVLVLVVATGVMEAPVITHFERWSS